MNPSDEGIRQTRVMLARVEAIQEALAALRQDLQAQLDGHERTARQAAGGDSSDRRAVPRAPSKRVLIELESAFDDSPPFRGWVVDCSAVGVGLAVERAVPAGMHISLQLEGERGAEGERIEAVVRHCHSAGRWWRLGCQVNPPLTPDQMRTFGCGG